jgi:hypothetical protein
LDAALAPEIENQGRLLAQLRAKELHQLKARLIAEPSLEAGFVPYSGTLRPDEITKAMTEARDLFLSTDGSALSSTEFKYFLEFLKTNDALIDLTSPTEWSKAFAFVQSKLNPRAGAEVNDAKPFRFGLVFRNERGRLASGNHRMQLNRFALYSPLKEPLKEPLTNSQVANILWEVRRSRTPLDAYYQSQDVERGRRETR